MPEPSPLVHSLFDRLRLSPGVAAQVDWSSGVLLVNRGLEQWQQFFRFPQGDLPLAVTLEHESHHIIQISTLTYLYRFAVLVHAILASLLNQHYGHIETLPETLGENAETVKNSVWDLNWRDDSGLSIVDIVESLTYFSQNGDRQQSTDAYLDFLQRAPVSEEYKRGFYVFANNMRDLPNGPLYFPILSHLSLCSWDPRSCFVRLAKAAAAGRIGQNTSLTDLLSLCREAEPSFPGFAWEYSRGIAQQMPIRFTFNEVQKDLVKDHDSLSKLLPYFFDPKAHSKDFASKVLNQTPAVLNPVSDSQFTDFRKWFTDMRGIRNFGAFTLEQRRYWLLYLAAVSRKYIEAIGVPPAGVVRREK